jgi:chemotaxis protein methyltransferase CheR
MRSRHWPVPTEAQSCAIGELLLANTGVALGADRAAWLRDRLEVLLNTAKFSDWQQAIEKADSDARFRQQLLDALLTNETRWFRDAALFKQLPAAMRADAEALGRPLRIAFLGCATGQEVYSVLMALDEHDALTKTVVEWPVQGMDVSRSALTQARCGVYTKAVTQRGLSEQQRSHYFDPHPDGYQLQSRWREWVRFDNASLLRFTCARPFDWLFCRNVLVYFPDTVRAVVYQRLLQCLAAQGTLVLGASEKPEFNAAQHLQRHDLGGVAVYQRR